MSSEVKKAPIKITNINKEPSVPLGRKCPELMNPRKNTSCMIGTKKPHTGHKAALKRTKVRTATIPITYIDLGYSVSHGSSIPLTHEHQIARYASKDMLKDKHAKAKWKYGRLTSGDSQITRKKFVQ